MEAVVRFFLPRGAIKALHCAEQPGGVQGPTADDPLELHRTRGIEGRSVVDPRDPEGLVPLVAECAMTSGSVLVFCATCASCQACAALLAAALPDRVGPPSQVHALMCGFVTGCTPGTSQWCSADGLCHPLALLPVLSMQAGSLKQSPLLA